MSLVELVELMIKRLVDFPEDVEVSEAEGEASRIIEVRVHPDDVGKVIGRKGRTADALRVLVSAVSGRENKRTVFQILD